MKINRKTFPSLTHPYHLFKFVVRAISEMSVYLENVILFVAKDVRMVFARLLRHALAILNMLKILMDNASCHAPEVKKIIFKF